MVDRVKNWERKLTEAIEERANMPFQWGVNDCSSFANFVLERVTGKNYFKILGIPVYSSKLGAAKIIKKYADGDLLKFADMAFGERKKPVKLKRGNIVACDTEDGPALGVWVSPYAVFAGEEGLIRASRQELICAWES